MPTPAALFGTGLVSSTAYSYSVTIGSTEVGPSGADLYSLSFEETSDDSPGWLECRVWDPNNSIAIAEQQVVRVHDNVAGTQVWLGFVMQRFGVSEGPGRWIDVRAVSAGAMLDEIIVDGEYRPAESDRTRVAYLWGKYARYPLGVGVGTIASTDLSVAADTLTGMTLRAALTQTAGLTNTQNIQFFVNSLGNLVWRSGSTVTAAPFNINVAVTPGSGNIAPSALKVTRDGVIKNRYYVRAAVNSASGWYQDDASVSAYGPREDLIEAPEADTATKARYVALQALSTTAQPSIRVEFSTIDPNSGWRPDQNVVITSAADDLSAVTMRTVMVRTSFWRGDGKRKYEIYAGKRPVRLSLGLTRRLM